MAARGKSLYFSTGDKREVKGNKPPGPPGRVRIEVLAGSVRVLVGATSAEADKEARGKSKIGDKHTATDGVKVYNRPLYIVNQKDETWLIIKAPS